MRRRGRVGARAVGSTSCAQVASGSRVLSACAAFTLRANCDSGLDTRLLRGKQAASPASPSPGATHSDESSQSPGGNSRSRPDSWVLGAGEVPSSTTDRDLDGLAAVASLVHLLAAGRPIADAAEPERPHADDMDLRRCEERAYKIGAVKRRSGLHPPAAPAPRSFSTNPHNVHNARGARFPDCINRTEAHLAAQIKNSTAV